MGGFRLGLEAAGWQVVWSNQWEPSTRVQHASACYLKNFGDQGHSNEDISLVPAAMVPDHDLLVGGFPCQDYSVAKTLSHARGIEGKKGVLWWEILRILSEKRPPFVLLENVDRLLKSPAVQRGRDFAIILTCLAHLGYVVEWRVANAADYGFPQRRRRVFILARPSSPEDGDPVGSIFGRGILAQALPVETPIELPLPVGDSLPEDLVAVTKEFGGRSKSAFENAGLMKDFKYWTYRVQSRSEEPATLGDTLEEGEVPEEFFIPLEQVPVWAYLKGPKREPRTNKSGFSYVYAEGAIPFPDPLDRPARTILTGEGGPSPSRFKHVIEDSSGRFRRLTPTELERLNGFPPGWTEIAGISSSRRAFLMGNALVVGLVERIGLSLRESARGLVQSWAPSSSSFSSIDLPERAGLLK